MLQAEPHQPLSAVISLQAVHMLRTAPAYLPDAEAHLAQSADQIGNRSRTAVMNGLIETGFDK